MLKGRELGNLRREQKCVCVFVCVTYEAIRVLGAGTAAGALSVAAVADVRPEASTVTLLRTHRLCHCTGSGFFFFKGLTHIFTLGKKRDNTTSVSKRRLM